MSLLVGSDVGEGAASTNTESFLDTMNAGCLHISAEDCQGWIKHAKGFQCPAREKKTQSMAKTFFLVECWFMLNRKTD